MADAPFFRGEDAVLRLFVNGKEVVLNAKTWTAKAVVTKGWDHVGGEKRGRPFRVVDGWEFSFTGYQSDTAAFEAWLSDISNDDASGAPLAKSATVRIQPKGSTRTGFIASEMVLDEPEMNQGGRGEAVMLNSGFRCRYFKKVAG